ncbi:hypothetical protein [Pedobacter nutrimenti]|uniref:hypothetical protein n=1 Tax=Pedobacter nutrimenti TaxID=1241337 RepID=UPI00292DAB75|nr:hypothetical protein [Pedobacter nutrimenti]
MKTNRSILVIFMALCASACSSNIVNRSFAIYTGKSFRTVPLNDSCYTKHIDIVHFTNENQQLYYKEVYICKTQKGRTKKEETRLGETFQYSIFDNKIITPGAVYDTLEITRRGLKTEHGFLKPMSAKKTQEYRKAL